MVGMKVYIPAGGSWFLVPIKNKAMSAQARCAAAIVAYVLLDEEQRPLKRKRQFWVRKWVKNRERHGLCVNLLREIRSDDSSAYKNFIRMSSKDFDTLFHKVTPIIAKQDTLMRKSISAAERLTTTFLK
ncbi:madf domain transcription factor [Holotrichia oblita]|uniref:Madf domain transcription factor n=1 Tax=Holotrichia oblita TaxID=644536 RepID=A0ACB9T8X5_HOLOL|nr:madf domain transcription factor [Holotrichia oblita]